MATRAEIDENIVGASDFYPLDERGLGRVYYEAMLKHADKIAQIDATTGETCTYGSLLKRSIRTAITMQKRGVKPGDFVSLCSYNHLDDGTPHLACWFTGAVMAAVPPNMTANEATFLLEQIKPKMIFTTPTMTEVLEEAVNKIKSETEIVVFGETDAHTPFSEFLKTRDEEDAFEPFEPKSSLDTAVVYYTSGTTGLQKAMCHNHASVLRPQLSWLNAGYRMDLALMYETPFWGLFVELLGCLIFTGGVRVVPPLFNAATFWEAFKYKITYTILTISDIVNLRPESKPEDVDVDSLQYMCVVGSCLTMRTIENLENLFPKAEVFNIYGQTEMAGCMTLFKRSDPHDMALKSKNPTSVGRPLPGLSYKIVDLKTNEILGPNQKGELRVKTKFKMNGYLGSDFSHELDAEGWLKTGDVAYYDEDRCFFVVERIKELIKFQGLHVIPALVESVIMKHPAVVEAVVIGVPHEVDEEHPVAVVVLNSTDRGVDAKEIEKFANEHTVVETRLAGGVKIVDKLPTTPNGKINRWKVKQLVIAGEI